MVEQATDLRLKFGDFKTICQVPKKVSTKYLTNFSHFAWILVNEMKPRDILC